ncbi:MAG TPA: MlaD family protein [Longimicrobiales bacterium]|nr:MlaD family protein [Longimicrobiales bacterium]
MRGEARQTRRALLGGGLILLLVAIGTGIFLLDDMIAALRSTYRIGVIVPDAPGLVAGSAVWVGGREVGTVRTLEFLPARADSAARLLLRLELPASVRQQVRRDSDVRVTTDGLVGQPVVDLLPGSVAAPALRDGDTLLARPRPTAADVRRRAAALQVDIDSLRDATASLSPLVARRQAGFARMERQLAATQREFEALMRDVERSPALALLGGDEVARVTAQLDQVLQEVGRALDRQQEQLRRSGAADGLVSVGGRAAELRATLAALQAEMRAGGGMIDRLERDSALLHAIDRARTELDSLVAEVRRNPLRFAF